VLAPLRKIAPLAVLVQTLPLLSTIWLAGGTRVLFGDSPDGVGVGVGVGVDVGVGVGVGVGIGVGDGVGVTLGVGVGVAFGSALDAVKLHTGPSAV